MNKYFFDIPIYRCDKKTFENEMESKRRRFVFKPGFDDEKWANEYFEKIYCYPWAFNKIIGWLRLYFNHTLIIEYWHVDKKQIKKGVIKKKFKRITDKLTEIYISHLTKVLKKL